MQITDIKAQKKRDKWQRIVNLLFPFTLSYTLILAIFFLMPDYSEKISLLFFIPSIIFIIITLIGIGIVKHTKIYSYKYLKRLSFKIFLRDNYRNFLHSKVYIIDNQIAYLGSLNYTHSGTKHSIETRTKLTEPEVINKINSLFYEIWENQLNLTEYTWQDIVKDFYHEPIN